MEKGKHLDLEARTFIETQLNKSASFKEIGEALGKDCSTISKEVRKHIVHEQTGGPGKGFNDCARSVEHACGLRGVCNRCFYKTNRPCWSCGKCITTCVLYEKYICPKLKKPPYVCNGCPTRGRCVLEKSLYRAGKAQQEYDHVKSEARSGVDISEEELRQLNSMISPLLRRGQSLHHIALNHPDEIMKSERTLYKYVDEGLFDARNLDMPRTVRMHPRKEKKTALKVDKSCRIGRTYADYQVFIESHPYLPVRELDTVEGTRGGAVLLTIQFVESELQLAFLRETNNSQSVINVFDRLYLELRPDIFMNLFPVLLADNGSEFSNPKAIEYDMQGNPRTRVFYCEPNAPYQKPHCENNHEMIRRCIPKGVDIGQYTQGQISLMMSHINSYERENLGNKSPYDVFAFQYGEDILHAMGLKKIPADEITLTPKVFKQD